MKVNFEENHMKFVEFMEGHNFKVHDMCYNEDGESIGVGFIRDDEKTYNQVIVHFIDGGEIEFEALMIGDEEDFIDEAIRYGVDIKVA